MEISGDFDGRRLKWRCDRRDDGPRECEWAVLLDDELVFWSPTEKWARFLVSTLGEGLPAIERRLKKRLEELVEAREMLAGIPGGGFH